MDKRRHRNSPWTPCSVGAAQLDKINWGRTLATSAYLPMNGINKKEKQNIRKHARQFMDHYEGSRLPVPPLKITSTRPPPPPPERSGHPSQNCEWVKLKTHFAICQSYWERFHFNFMSIGRNKTETRQVVRTGGGLKKGWPESANQPAS